MPHLPQRVGQSHPDAIQRDGIRDSIGRNWTNLATSHPTFEARCRYIGYYGSRDSRFAIHRCVAIQYVEGSHDDIESIIGEIRS